MCLHIFKTKNFLMWKKNQNFSDTEKENLKIFWCENCRAKSVFKKKYIYFPKYSPPSIDKKF